MTKFSDCQWPSAIATPLLDYYYSIVTSILAFFQGTSIPFLDVRVETLIVHAAGHPLLWGQPTSHLSYVRILVRRSRKV